MILTYLYEHKNPTVSAMNEAELRVSCGHSLALFCTKFVDVSGSVLRKLRFIILTTILRKNEMSCVHVIT